MNRFTGCYVPYTWAGAMTNSHGLTSRERSIDVVFPGFSHRLNLKGNYLEWIIRWSGSIRCNPLRATIPC